MQGPYIVYGPPGCGKTSHKENIKSIFNANTIHDMWYGEALGDYDLALTNMTLAMITLHCIAMDLKAILIPYECLKLED